jgi:hypothetical protein
MLPSPDRTYTGDAEVAGSTFRVSGRRYRFVAAAFADPQGRSHTFAGPHGLANGLHSGTGEAPLRIAEKLARRISKEKVSWADLLPHWRAAVAHARLDSTEAPRS